VSGRGARGEDGKWMIPGWKNTFMGLDDRNAAGGWQKGRRVDHERQVRYRMGRG
jgi:hypothetical protein